MMTDIIYVLILFSIAAVVILAYVIRVATKGQAHFSRIDKHGGSAFLSKNIMEMAYWSMQPLAKLLIFFRFTPNRISWSSLVFGFLAGLCLVFGHFGSAAAAATISALLDSLDGMVARLTGLSSDAGEVLDAAVDRYVEFMFLAGLVIYYREIPLFLIITLLALLGSFMVSYSTAKAEALGIDPPKGSMRRPERAVYLTLGAAFSPFTIPIFEKIREYPVAIGHPMIMALALVALVSNISAIERLAAIAKAIRLREKKIRNTESVDELSGNHSAEQPLKP